jgi:hypothetical protein
VKIFLSSRYSRREELCRYRDELQAMGHTVTSRWLVTSWRETDESGGSSAAPPEYRQEFATKDMVDVECCDCLIAFNEEPRSGGRGGRHVEYGAALAMGKLLIVVGHRENIFHHHHRVHFYPTWEDAKASLELKEASQR